MADAVKNFLNLITTQYFWDMYSCQKIGLENEWRYWSGIFPPEQQSIAYNAFDKVSSITEGNQMLQINYGHHRQRIGQQYTAAGITTTKVYAGACEYITKNGQTTIHTYLSGPEGLFALHVKNPNGTENIRYIQKDHLGSWNTISDENGNLLQELSFDACSVKLGFCECSETKALVEQIPTEARSREGNRRNPATWRAFTDKIAAALFDRGFTGHSLSREERNGKHLYGFQLINPDTLHCIALSGSATANFSLHCVCENQASADMNGRMGVYPERHSLFGNPVVSRMLSPDNFVQAPDFSQSFNRYSYCWNNPLVLTDPSGEFITWSFSNGRFSIGFNLTPIGIPLGAGINIGWGDGASLGDYGEVGYRVGGTGFGSGVTVSQSIDYNFKHSDWSTTTAEGAYASFGSFNAGINFSQTYDMTSKQWSNGWGISAGVGIGNDAYGLGLNVGYGSGGWTYGLGGYFNPEKPSVYKSPVSNNYGDKNGECVLRCLEEFSSSYGMDKYDFNYWFEENGEKLGVHGSRVEGLIDNSGIFSSDPINARDRVNAITEAFSNNKRVLWVLKQKVEENTL